MNFKNKYIVPQKKKKEYMGISFFPDMGDPRENQTGVALDSVKRTPWKGKTPPHT